jgi:hypothetical protein
MFPGRSQSCVRSGARPTPNHPSHQRQARNLGSVRSKHARWTSISQWFNALNVSLWRFADSADWADEEKGEGDDVGQP